MKTQWFVTKYNHSNVEIKIYHRNFENRTYTKKL